MVDCCADPSRRARLQLGPHAFASLGKQLLKCSGGHIRTSGRSKSRCSRICVMIGVLVKKRVLEVGLGPQSHLTLVLSIDLPLFRQASLCFRGCGGSCGPLANPPTFTNQRVVEGRLNSASPTGSVMSSCTLTETRRDILLTAHVLPNHSFVSSLD